MRPCGCAGICESAHFAHVRSTFSLDAAKRIISDCFLFFSNVGFLLSSVTLQLIVLTYEMGLSITYKIASAPSDDSLGDSLLEMSKPLCCGKIKTKCRLVILLHSTLKSNSLV